MPQRALNIVLAILGLCAVAALVIAGADAYAHTRRGPKWWRRIVGAGLAFVAMLGIGACEKKPMVACYAPKAMPAAQATVLSLQERAGVLDEFVAAETLDRETTLIVLETIEDKLAILSDEAALALLSPDERKKAEELRDKVRVKIDAIRKKLGASPEAQGLEATDDWQTVIAAWREIKPYARTGESTSAQRISAKAKLDAARVAITKLAGAGELSQPEAALLVSEADRLQKEMLRGPPVDSHVKCYIMMRLNPTRVSLERIAKRLPLLEALAGSGDINAAALAKVLPSIEADLATLGGKENLKHLGPKEREKANALCSEVRTKIDAIRKKLAPTTKPQSLEATDEWQRLVKIWREAEEIASGKRGDYPFDDAGKKRILAALETAARDVDAFAKAKLLSTPEAELLKADLATLTRSVGRKRPTEMRRAECYKSMMIVPARESLKRLKARLPMLKAIFAKGVVTNDVVKQILARAVEDAGILLADKKWLARLSEAERTEAEEVAKATRRLLFTEEISPRHPADCYMPILRLSPAEPDASVIRRRMELLAAFASERTLGDEAAAAALRSAEDELAELEGGRA